MDLEKVNFEKFRQHLERTLMEKKEKNANYSLRAFSRDLEINAACLSVILRGKRPLTKKLVSHFADKLKLDTPELKKLSIGADIINLEKEDMPTDISWHFDVITELMKLDSFKLDEDWIAEALGIHKREVQESLELLQKHGFIKIDGDKWEILKPNTEYRGRPSSLDLLDRYFAELIEISLEKFEEQSAGKKYYSTQTLPVRLSDMEEAQDMIRDFRKKFVERFEMVEDRDDVYQLQVNLFPMTSLQKIKN